MLKASARRVCCAFRWIFTRSIRAYDRHKVSIKDLLEIMDIDAETHPTPPRHVRLDQSFNSADPTTVQIRWDAPEKNPELVLSYTIALRAESDPTGGWTYIRNVTSPHTIRYKELYSIKVAKNTLENSRQILFTHFTCWRTHNTVTVCRVSLSSM